ncbi:MAG: class F sortase [Knoellia sp.]
MSVASPDSVPRAEATTTSHEARSLATSTPSDNSAPGPATPPVGLSATVTATESREPTTSSAGTPTVTSGTANPSSSRVADPVGIRIPAISLSARIDEMGLQKDRTVEVPNDPWRTGWYGLGPEPGEPGSAVILGHVDSRAGAAVFGRLDELRAGDRVIVETRKGTFATFEVIRLKTYPNAKFPGDTIYASPGPERLLNLITCAGRYDRDTGRPANLVVFTRLIRAA